ncbi:GlxA family transcriptional regulator [Ancylobacter sp. A5.8]|uniref:GlxA family transcriptional regulator n=1 Tax=Ancylobacter gelatini TaxID=2919920 RepID=UPI001F4DCE50|nr:GlxA family transcriptional regulator [Ancylobacter gelatini]
MTAPIGIGAPRESALLLDKDHEPLRFGFLLAPRFSMMSLSSAIEPIRVANRLLGRKAFDWYTCSTDGQPVMASNDLVLEAGAVDEATDRIDALVLCGGTRLTAAQERPIIRALRNASRRKRAIGALSTATHLVARAGLLAGYRCTIHWENLPALREEFPGLIVTEAVYEIDRDRLTSSGGTTAMDMMLHIILLRYGSDIAHEVAAQFQHAKIRAHNEPQSGWRQRNLTYQPPVIRRATTIMQEHIEDPLAIREIADQAGISERQMERLFTTHLSLRPMHYYLMLRTERARELLSYTEQPLVEIAVATGFGSVAHFSRWFLHFHDQLPSQYRKTSRTGV